MNYAQLREMKSLASPALDTLVGEIETRLAEIDNSLEFRFNEGALGSHTIYGDRHIITLHPELADETDLAHELLHLKLHLDGYPHITTYKAVEGDPLPLVLAAWLGSCIKHPVIIALQKAAGMNVGPGNHRQAEDTLARFSDKQELGIMDLNFGALMMAEFYFRQPKSMFSNLVKKVEHARPDMLKRAGEIIAVLAQENDWRPRTLAGKSIQIIELLGMSKILVAVCINGNVYYNDEEALPAKWLQGE